MAEKWQKRPKKERRREERALPKKEGDFIYT
jgi:hypothetical protein